MKKIQKLALLSLTGILLTYGGSGMAASPATTTLGVSAVVEALCTIDAGTPLSIGTLDFSSDDSSPPPFTGSFSVICTNGTAAQIALDNGQTGTSPVLRKLVDPISTNTLTYGLYTDTGRTTAWGDTGANDKEITGTGATQTQTVYGKILSGLDAAHAGTYEDEITITVTF
jgi:spore coat protein U-like protein